MHVKLERNILNINLVCDDDVQLHVIDWLVSFKIDVLKFLFTYIS